MDSQISRPISLKQIGGRNEESEKTSGLQKVILVISFIVFVIVSGIFLTFVKRIEKEEEEDIYGKEQNLSKNPEEPFLSI